MVGWLGLFFTAASAAPEGARLVVEPVHTDDIRFAAWSADGTRVVTGGADGAAIVWHAASGAGLRRLEGHGRRVAGAAFSPDGTRVVTFNDYIDDGAILWDAEQGTRLFTLPHDDYPSEAAFTPDGARLAVATRDGTAKLWNAATGELIATLADGPGEGGAVARVSANGARVVTQKPDRNGVTVWDTATGQALARVVDDKGVIYAVLSADGSRLFTTDRDNRAKLWDTASGSLVRKVKAKALLLKTATFSPDGKWVAAVTSIGTAYVVSTLSGKSASLPEIGGADRYTDAGFTASGSLVTGHYDRTLRIFDPSTASETRRITLPRSDYHDVSRIAISPHGTQVIVVDRSASVWDLADGHLLHALTSDALGVRDATFARDGKKIASANLDGTATVWNLLSGGPERTLAGKDKPLWTVAFSDDGTHLATGAQYGTSAWWDLATGEALQTIADHEGPVFAITVAPDGARVASAGLDGQVHEWNTGSGVQVHNLDSPKTNAITVDYSADGKALYTANTTGGSGTIEVHDAATGAVTQRLAAGELVCAAFSPDGKKVIAAVRDGKFDVLDVATSKVLQHAEGHSISSCTFSPDGQRVAVGSWDGMATVYHVAKNSVVARLEGHSGRIYAIEFSPDGKWVLTGSLDGTSRVWDAANGREKLALVSFAHGGWAAVDPDGRFDASEDGRVDGLVWVIDGEPYALDQLREQYYEPGLVAKVLGGRTDPLRAVPPLSSIRRPPQVELNEASGKLEIRIEDEGGGIGQVFVRLNASDISDHVAAACPTLGTGGTCTIDVSRLPTWKTGDQNQLEAFASVAGGVVRSRGTVREVLASGPKSTDPPDLWVLAVGSGDYSGNALDLQYAGFDAVQFATAIRVAGQRGFGADRTHVQVVSTDPGQQRPSKDTLRMLASWMASADPGDTFVLFLSGHGVALGDDYFYVLPDAESFDDLKDAGLRAKRSWSGQEISEALTDLAPLKRVVILDTCAAGALNVASLAAPRALSSDAIRAHARVQERTGAWFLAGAAADQVSYEASRFGEGILTYALLEGMRGPALDDANLLFVSRLFAHAEQQVPIYARGIGGIQRPVIRRAEAGDFVLGELGQEDRSKVPLQQVKPVLVRARVVPVGGRADRLGIEPALNRALREAAGTDGAGFVVWDSEPVDDTWQVTGTYAEKPGSIQFTGYLTRTGDRAAEIAISASGPDATAVVKAVVEQVAAKVR